MTESNLLSEILLQYGMSHAKADLIRHNENMTYCIEDKYLLRIHKAKPGFSTAYFEDVNTIKRRENELAFLMNLNANGLYIQSPIKNMEDQWVTVCEDGTAATMLTWLPGRILNKEELDEKRCYDLGKMLGKMHRAARGYHADEAIHYDQTLCRKLIRLLSDYYNSNKMNQKYFESMSNALELIGEKLAQSEPLFLHSDLSLSNILVTEEGLVPIDFSLFGDSSPLLDFGSVFCFVDEATCRKKVIEGYEEVTGIAVKEKETAYYVAFQILLGIVLHYDLWFGEDWFVKRLPEWCNNHFDTLCKME